MLQSTKLRYRPLIAWLPKPFVSEVIRNVSFKKLKDLFSLPSEAAILIDGDGLINSVITDQIIGHMVEHEISHIEH